MCSKNDDVDEKSQFVRNLHWSHQSVDENLHDCKTSEVRWGYFDGIIALHFESCELRCKHHYQVLPLSVASIHGDACRIRAKAESALKACMFATVASLKQNFLGADLQISTLAATLQGIRLKLRINGFILECIDEKPTWIDKRHGKTSERSV